MTFRTLLFSPSPEFSRPCWSGRCSIPKRCCSRRFPSQGQKFPKKHSSIFPAGKHLRESPRSSVGFAAAVLPAALLCPTPLPGGIRHFGKSLLPVFPPCSPWSSREHWAPSPPLPQVLVPASSSWDVSQDVETPAMNDCWNSSGNGELFQCPSSSGQTRRLLIKGSFLWHSQVITLLPSL